MKTATDIVLVMIILCCFAVFIGVALLMMRPIPLLAAGAAVGAITVALAHGR